MDASKSPNKHLLLKIFLIIWLLIITDLCTYKFFIRKFGCSDGVEVSLYQKGAFISPNKEFRIAVCKESWYSYFPTMGPGSIGDAPGYFYWDMARGSRKTHKTQRVVKTH